MINFVTSKAYKLFDKALKQGAEIFFLVEELNDDEEQARRWETCKTNECGLYHAKRDKCLACTCYMEVKTGMLKHINVKKRGRVEVTHCPMAMWGGEKEKEIANYYRHLDGDSLI